MVLIFSDDRVVRIVESEREAIQQCEGIDVQSLVCWFYDDTGRPLVPVFDVPVTEKRFLGIFKSIDSGKYHLEPGDMTHPMYVDPLWVSLSEAVALEPNPYYDDLEQLKNTLRMRGIQVDAPSRDG
jgi:hypothetical protein